jgi:lysophosphatidylcholine acyltransferase/lyso-PAF acetyltransferase
VNHLEVVRLPVYQPTEKEYADPKLYANNVRTLMADEVRPLFSLRIFCKQNSVLLSISSKRM